MRKHMVAPQCAFHVVQTAGMAKNKRKRNPKAVLKLPDLEHSKSAVLNSLTSPSSQRSYDHAIREFIEWYCSEPRLPIKRALLQVSGAADSGRKPEAWPTLWGLMSAGRCPDERTTHDLK